MKNFNWEEFKNNEFAVHCKTEIEANNFLKEATKHGITWREYEPLNSYNHWDRHESETCYDFETLNMTFADKTYYIDSGYEIVEWSIEEDIIYNKEYSIQEIFDFQEGMEFKNAWGFRVRVKSNKVQILNRDMWEDVKIINEDWVKFTFTLLKKDKEITFEEAMKSFGKIVYNITTINGIEYKHTYNIPSSMDMQVKDDKALYLTPREILEGKWYLVEN